MMGDRSDDGNLETTRDSQSRFLGRPHTWGDSLHGNANPRIHASQHDRCGYACLLDGCPLPWDLVHETADIPRRVPVLASFCAGVMAIRTTLVACVPFHLEGGIHFTAPKHRGAVPLPHPLWRRRPLTPSSSGGAPQGQSNGYPLSRQISDLLAWMGHRS